MQLHTSFIQDEIHFARRRSVLRMTIYSMCIVKVRRAEKWRQLFRRFEWTFVCSAIGLRNDIFFFSEYSSLTEFCRTEYTDQLRAPKQLSTSFPLFTAFFLDIYFFVTGALSIRCAGDQLNHTIN